MGVPFSVPGGLRPEYPSLAKAAQDLAGWYRGDAILYRVTAQSYAVCVDPDRDRYVSSDPRLELNGYRIKRVTPAGYWIDGPHGERWVRTNSPGGKEFASRTPEEALRQFIERRRAQIRIVERQLTRARAELALTAEGDQWRPNPLY